MLLPGNQEAGVGQAPKVIHNMSGERRSRKFYEQLARYANIIFLIPACLLVGFFIGRVVDGYLGTDPWFLLLFLLLGGAAALIEVIRILKG